MRLRAIIFDLDGTLANTLPVCFHAIRVSLREFTGREYTDAEITEMFGPSEKGIIQRHVPERWKEAYQVLLREYESMHPMYTEPAPGIIGVLAMLRRRGVKLGIATGKGAETAEISLKYTGLAAYFDAIETGSVKGGFKSEAIEKLLAEWGIARDEAAYVGDAPADMQAAKDAGVFAIGAAWLDTTEGSDLSDAAIVFRSVSEFAEWIEANV